MTDLERLVGLARIVRAAFERVAREHDFKPDLGGLCYDASCFLLRMARMQGIPAEMGHGNCHWFVLLGDTVVDVTATQFGVGERIAVLPLEEAGRRGYWWSLVGRMPNPPPPWSQAIMDSAERAVLEAIVNASEE